MTTCPECGGSGVLDEGTENERRCDTCGGTGFVPDDQNDDGDVLQTSA
jgi:DnaJ-class molecular chaperone